MRAKPALEKRRQLEANEATKILFTANLTLSAGALNIQTEPHHYRKPVLTIRIQDGRIIKTKAASVQSGPSLANSDAAAPNWRT